MKIFSGEEDYEAWADAEDLDPSLVERLVRLEWLLWSLSGGPHQVSLCSDRRTDHHHHRLHGVEGVWLVVT